MRDHLCIHDVGAADAKNPTESAKGTKTGNGLEKLFYRGWENRHVKRIAGCSSSCCIQWELMMMV